MAKLIQDIGTTQIAGLSTPEIRRRGIRTGFKMIDLASGQEEVLASTSGYGPAVGKYRVNLEGIDKLVEKIDASLNSARFVFIDEIGKMELFSEKFKRFVERAFSLDKPIVAVVHRNLVPRYRKKGMVFVVSRSNFEKVREAILAELKSV